MISTYLSIYKREIENKTHPACGLKSKDINSINRILWHFIVEETNLLYYGTMSDLGIRLTENRKIDAAVYQFLCVVGYNLINGMFKLRNKPWYKFNNTIEFEIPIPESHIHHISGLENIKYGIIYLLLRYLRIINVFEDNNIKICKTSRSKNSIKFKVKFKKINEFTNNSMYNIYRNYLELLEGIIEHSNFNFIEGFVKYRRLFIISDTNLNLRLMENPSLTSINSNIILDNQVPLIFGTVREYAPNLSIINTTNCPVSTGVDFNESDEMPTIGARARIISKKMSEIEKNKEKNKKIKNINNEKIIEVNIKQDLF